MENWNSIWLKTVARWICRTAGRPAGPVYDGRYCPSIIAFTSSEYFSGVRGVQMRDSNAAENCWLIIAMEPIETRTCSSRNWSSYLQWCARSHILRGAVCMCIFLWRWLMRVVTFKIIHVGQLLSEVIAILHWRTANNETFPIPTMTGMNSDRTKLCRGMRAFARVAARRIP